MQNNPAQFSQYPHWCFTAGEDSQLWNRSNLRSTTNKSPIESISLTAVDGLVLHMLTEAIVWFSHTHWFSQEKSTPLCKQRSPDGVWFYVMQINISLRNVSTLSSLTLPSSSNSPHFPACFNDLNNFQLLLYAPYFYFESYFLISFNIKLLIILW